MNTPDSQLPDAADASGKTNDWRPRLNEPLALETVPESTRPSLEQRAHYAMLAVSMRASIEEAEDIVEALQFCENKHGLSKVKPILPLIVSVIGNAVTLMQVSITFMGIQRHIANAGLFVGSLIEHLAEVDSSTRRFPLSQYQERLNSPHVEFEDCLIGVGIAKRFIALGEMRPQQALPYCALVNAFRTKRRAKGMLALENLSRELQGAGHPIATWLTAIDTLASKEKVKLPPQWRTYVRECGHDTPQ